MSARQAIGSDTQFLLDENVKHNPSIKLDEASIRHLLSDPNEIICVDPALKTVCRFNINSEFQNVKLVWLYPQEAPMTDFQSVLKRSINKVYNDHPQARNWKIYAIFEKSINGKQRANLWKSGFGNDIEEKDYGWEVSLPTVSDAKAVIDNWP